MAAAEELPQNAHIIEVDRVGTGYSVSHCFNQRLLYTATYRNKIDALRTANRMAGHFHNQGEEAVLYVRTDLRR